MDPLPEKNAAFIEFRSPVECSNALALSGQELDGAKLRISRRRDYEPCPAHLLHVVVPVGLPPPTTALQQRVAKMDGSIQAGYGARPGTSAATLRGEGLVFDGFGWSKAGQPRNREARTQTPLELSYNARCVYVGNLPPTEILDNEALKSLFQRAMVERGWHDTSKELSPSSPMVLGVFRDASSKWAFLEFRTVAEATTAMGLSGIMCGTTALVVNRTKGYTPVSDELYPQLKAAGVMGNTVVCPDGRATVTASTAASAQQMGIAVVPGVEQSNVPGGGPSIAGVPQRLMNMSRRVRKVFVGNLPREAPELSAEYLLAFFTEAMTAA